MQRHVGTEHGITLGRDGEEGGKTKGAGGVRGSDKQEYKSSLVRHGVKDGVTLSGCLQLLTESETMQHAAILQQERHTANKNTNRDIHASSTQKTLLSEQCNQHNTVLWIHTCIIVYINCNKGI